MNFTPVIIESISNHTFNFKNFLNKNDTIIWRNCDNIKIKINSKVNKMIFENCNNINISMSDAIIGVEFFKCSNIVFKVRKNKKINCIESFLSSIQLNIYKKNKDSITFLTEKSNLIFK